MPLKGKSGDEYDHVTVVHISIEDVKVGALL